MKGKTQNNWKTAHEHFRHKKFKEINSLIKKKKIKIEQNAIQKKKKSRVSIIKDFSESPPSLREQQEQRGVPTPGQFF